jgi:hypothetical protein
MNAELNKAQPYTLRKERYWLYERNLKTMEVTKTLVERNAGTNWLGANNKSYWYERYVDEPNIEREAIYSRAWRYINDHKILSALTAGIILWALKILFGG